MLYEGKQFARTVMPLPREILRAFVDPNQPSVCSSWKALCLNAAGSTMRIRSLPAFDDLDQADRVRVPEIPMYLDALLSDQPLIGGLEPMPGSAPAES